MEAVLVVFTALLRREGENQPCQSSQEARLCRWASCAPSARAGGEPEGGEMLHRLHVLSQVTSRMRKSEPRAAPWWKGNTRRTSKAEQNPGGNKSQRGVQGDLPRGNSTWYKTRSFEFLHGEPFLQCVFSKRPVILWELQLPGKQLASVLQCLFKCKHR